MKAKPSASSNAGQSSSDRVPSKPARDAPKWDYNNPVGPINYPVWTTNDPANKKILKHFKVFPKSTFEIADYPQTFSYPKDKQGLVQKTGRNRFEVFKYTFQLGKDEKGNALRHTIMWDYNVGLVRITPFFKSLDYPKTHIAKVIKANDGLHNMCHSVTGGDIAAQGYWMPYTAAKEIATRWCYDIKHVLIPLFGEDFPSICLRPNDFDYKNFIIDPNIVLQSGIEAEEMRQVILGNRPARVPGTRSRAYFKPTSQLKRSGVGKVLNGKNNLSRESYGKGFEVYINDDADGDADDDGHEPKALDPNRKMPKLSRSNHADLRHVGNQKNISHEAPRQPSRVEQRTYEVRGTKRKISDTVEASDEGDMSSRKKFIPSRSEELLAARALLVLSSGKSNPHLIPFVGFMECDTPECMERNETPDYDGGDESSDRDSPIHHEYADMRKKAKPVGARKKKH